jgi:DNA polymerase elongation subunit (family B)
MHVINEEGKKTDKLKIMGVELKRSDTSKAVKSILKRMVDAVLAGDDIDGLKKIVAEEKKIFEDKPMTDIAKPSGCNTLATYQRKLAETGSKKGIPYQANAAMFYNSMCGVEDTRIDPGDKIGIIYIKHPDSKYMAYPIDTDQMPEWMDDIIIDYNMNWEKANNKIVNYMAAMGWDLESQKAEMTMNLFGFESKKVTKRKKRK